MGLLQGASELFPVSSLGHAVLVPSIFHWSFKQSDPSFLPFLVLLHIGTATANRTSPVMYEPAGTPRSAEVNTASTRICASSSEVPVTPLTVPGSPRRGRSHAAS